MKVGVLGAGQLGRMLALAGYPLGLEFVFLDKNKDACAGHLGQLIVGEFTDEKKLVEFCKIVDVVTYESENIPLLAAEFVSKHKPVHPSLKALETAQDRLFEKECFSAFEIATAPFLTINSSEDLKKAASEFGFPLLIKSRRLGYDGKNQFLIRSEDDLADLASRDVTDFIAEGFINFDREVSVIAVRSSAGDVRFYDVVENKHHDGVLHDSVNQPQDALTEIAQGYVKRILEKLNYVGVLAIEFFEKEGELMANEMAPRVHNSGHWTIEGAVCSQFENHLRAICGLPLGDTKSLGQFTMKNLLGEIPNREALLKQPGLHLHDYGKKPRPKRKLGHTNQRLT